MTQDIEPDIGSFIPKLFEYYDEKVVNPLT